MVEADAFAGPVLDTLRHRYRASANGALVLAPGLHKLGEARQLGGAETAVRVAALESFLADVLIAIAKSGEDLRAAEHLSSHALERLAAANAPTAQNKSLAVHTALLNGIAYKAIGDVDAAFVALERHASALKSQLGVGWLELAPLRRQSVLMSQTEAGFVALANESTAYRELRPAEYYANLKRFFEFLLNRRKLSPARSIFPIVRDAYIRAFSHLSPLGHVSFLKNTGQFVILDGYPRKGTALLYQALRAASQFQMHGQVRQINRLLNEAQDGQPTLEAFRI